MNEYYYIGFGIIAVLVIAFVIYRLLKVWTITLSKDGYYKAPPFPRKHYKFHNGLECYQEAMELWQTELFTALLADLDIDESTTLTLDSLNAKLFGKQGLLRLARIVLITKSPQPPFSRGNEKVEEMPEMTIPESVISRLKADELEEVMADFFTLNPKMKQLFGILKNALVSQMKTVQNYTDGGSMTDLRAQSSLTVSAED